LDAEFWEFYGGGSPERLKESDYERYVGLVLNMSRCQYRRADVFREAVAAAVMECVGGEPAPLPFFESRHYSPEEAAFMHKKAKSHYETSKSKAM
jgi:hypothetical protein